MFTLMCDIFIMCFVLSEILSMAEEKEYSRSLFPSAAVVAAAVVAYIPLSAAAAAAGAGGGCCCCCSGVNVYGCCSGLSVYGCFCLSVDFC